MSDVSQVDIDWLRSKWSEGPSAIRISTALAEVERLRGMTRRARDELGVPGPDYPANVANAVAILGESDEDTPLGPTIELGPNVPKASLLRPEKPVSLRHRSTDESLTYLGGRIGLLEVQVRELQADVDE